ncbi:MAG: class D beta-lactamase [Candidatus Omnitrophica bacterium]|nr:class D beta-lactamase [Candidatus Omnitrophota bacterium]
MKTFVVLLCTLLFLPVAQAWEIDRTVFGRYETALVIYNRASGEVVNAGPGLSARRLSPCSTFKIYNTLIGLELGLLPGPDNPWYKWDGVRRDIAGWNQDLSLREAFRVSAVPAFQGLARQIGPRRMQQYLDRIGYGTKDISAGIDTFWLSRAGQESVRISADEQVALLNKLLDGRLPFAAGNVATLKDIMQVLKTDRGVLYGKTGSGVDADGKWALGWFVGFLEHGGTTYVFACNITGGEVPMGKAARAIVESVFRAQGLL